MEIDGGTGYTKPVSYIVMELYEFRDLSALLIKHGSGIPTDIVRYFMF